eukprot:CAMPEP_0170481352 /NCGR_PEP_ID=MMETSP0208-20121228/1827_1 /TAXON_ID=197538 /ORGANISM="Strombidium inclinatum, Strain S3" /LENGTH=175 /DNA_ID=CAMNT_0010754039 /DNA_START=543 /DNA_END=1070 /DNA_ORIENTATION=-
MNAPSFYSPRNQPSAPGLEDLGLSLPSFPEDNLFPCADEIDSDLDADFLQPLSLRRQNAHIAPAGSNANNSQEEVPVLDAAGNLLFSMNEVFAGLKQQHASHQKNIGSIEESILGESEDNCFASLSSVASSSQRIKKEKRVNRKSKKSQSNKKKGLALVENKREEDAEFCAAVIV